VEKPECNQEYKVAAVWWFQTQSVDHCYHLWQSTTTTTTTICKTTTTTTLYTTTNNTQHCCWSFNPML